MKIINKYFTIKTLNNKVYYNKNEINYSSFKNLYDILLNLIRKEEIEKLYLYGEYEPLTNIEQIILLALSNNYANVYSKKYSKYLDISFSYNFSIHSQNWIIKDLLALGSKPLETNMIVLADSLEYLEKNVNYDDEYSNFYKKYGSYIKRGNKTFKIEKCDLSYAINYWNDYCKKRHNKDFNEMAIEVYNFVYSNSGFDSIKIVHNDETVVASVFFKDDVNKIIYFLITGWNDKYKKYSPCIYLYSKAIEYCHNNNYKFSFCYGKQSYKNSLLKYFGGKNE